MLGTFFGQRSLDAVLEHQRQFWWYILQEASTQKVNFSSKDQLLSRLTCVFKSNFSKAASYRLKAYFFVMKEIFAIRTLSFLFSDVTVFTSCEQGAIKRQ